MASSMEPYIAYTPGSCPNCGLRIEQEYVEIKYVEKGIGSWAVGGLGMCAGCGTVVKMITKYLPVEFPTLPCPTCSQIVEYSFAIESVHLEEGAFAFNATATCPQCNKSSTLSKIIRGLQRIKGIKVGPLGVELDTRDPG